MPFQKGHVPANKGVKKTDFVDVMEEMQQSVPDTSIVEEIVPKAPPLPGPTQKEGVIPQLPTEDEPDFGGIHGWNMAELEFMDIRLNRTAKIPKCVEEWCRSRNLVWRWLSYPAVKHFGMRGFVALSITPELRKKIKSGDCPPTVDIDVSNKLVWREDAFLGVMPKRLSDMIRKAKRQRVLDQTKLASAAPGGLREMAARAGGKLVEYSVEETSRQGL